MKITALDLIALVVLLAGFSLIAMGKDSFVQYVISAVVGYYFGRREEISARLKGQ